MKIIPAMHTVALCLIASAGCMLLPIPYEDAAPLEPGPVWYPAPPAVVATSAPIDHQNRRPPPPLLPPDGPSTDEEPELPDMAGCNAWKCQIIDTQALDAVGGEACMRDADCRATGQLCTFGLCVDGACQMMIDTAGTSCGYNRYCDPLGTCCWQD